MGDEREFDLVLSGGLTPAIVLGSPSIEVMPEPGVAFAAVDA